MTTFKQEAIDVISKWKNRSIWMKLCTDSM